MASSWDEISQAATEKRRELVLQGQKISKRLDKGGLDEALFSLSSLNYLEISGTCLSELKPGVEKLASLTKLVLCNNQLETLPSQIGNLSKLKLLNVSNNQLESLPEELVNLSELDTLNVSMNKLVSIPPLTKLTNIHICNIANNQLESLPEGIFDGALTHLSQILAGDNQITVLDVEISELPHLNTLDMSNNKLTSVPTSLSLCAKLKELNLKGNKFKDRRFGKMVDQCQTKSVLEYLHNIWKKENQAAGKGGGKDKDKKKKKGKKAVDETEELIRNMVNVLRFTDDKSLEIKVMPSVLSVRQYIVCCVVRNLDLQSKFKAFITLQTKLHDSVCQKRQAGTIATHDLKSVKTPLTYTAKFPQHLMITPLFKQKEVSGEKLFEDLRHEAEELRKEKKRNTFSGIHKYLDLLADKTQYPCLVDTNNCVISFPPITNSDKTKISKDTTDILIEVTSTTSLDTCKKIMDEVLYKMLEAGLGGNKPGNSGGAVAKGGNSSSSESSDDEGVVFSRSKGAAGGDKPVERLVVEQVKIIDTEHVLKVLYPSRTDLNSPLIEVIRKE